MPRVIDIYNQYKIMPLLQMHMLRVAAVASMICESIELEVERDDIIKAALFHDMGNIIKSKLDVFPAACEPEGLEYWEKIKKEFIEKYGSEEHIVNKKIMQEIGLSPRATELGFGNRFSLLCANSENKDLGAKIVQYADYRVGPFGILSFEERMAEAGERYKNHDAEIERRRQALLDCGRSIEKQIFQFLKIKPEDINDLSAKELIEQLKNFQA